MMMIIVQSGRVTSDEEEADYDYTSKWEYLGKGIWENQVRAVLPLPYIFLVFGVHTLTSLILIMQFVIGLVLVTELPGPGEPGWDGCN